jgi:RNA polymerase sigma factor (sigma-70 family)
MKKAIERLSPQLQTIIKKVHFEETPAKEIAGEMKVSEGRISQLRSTAYKEIRRSMRNAI